MRSSHQVLYIGGVKSGKSRLAETKALAIAHSLSLFSPFYLATADPNDRSLADRIQRHRHDRGDQFITLEEPFELVLAIEKAMNHYQVPPGKGVILIDCLTLWLSNHLLRSLSAQVNPQDPIDLGLLITMLHQTIDLLQGIPQTLIFVINDVGSGIHAETKIGRQFADLSGLTAQKIAAGCDEVYHCIAGIGHRIQ